MRKPSCVLCRHYYITLTNLHACNHIAFKYELIKPNRARKCPVYTEPNLDDILFKKYYWD